MQYFMLLHLWRCCLQLIYEFHIYMVASLVWYFPWKQRFWNPLLVGIVCCSCVRLCKFHLVKIAIVLFIFYWKFFHSQVSKEEWTIYLLPSRPSRLPLSHDSYNLLPYTTIQSPERHLALWHNNLFCVALIERFENLSGLANSKTKDFQIQGYGEK